MSHSEGTKVAHLSLAAAEYMFQSPSCTKFSNHLHPARPVITILHLIGFL